MLTLHCTFISAINIIPILCKECLIAVGAQFQGGGFVYQHEAEHPLDCQQQGMEIPDHCRTIFQFNVILRSNTLECCHGKLYDCDFNQAAEIPVVNNETIFDWVGKPYCKRKICFGKYCYGCTAGQGSSCGGATE